MNFQTPSKTKSNPPFIHSSMHPFISMHPCIHSFIHPFTHPIIHPTTRPSIHPSNHPPIHSSTHPSIHSSIHPPTRPSIHSSIHLHINHLNPWYFLYCTTPQGWDGTLIYSLKGKKEGRACAAPKGLHGSRRQVRHSLYRVEVTLTMLWRWNNLYAETTILSCNRILSCNITSL